MRQQAKAKLYFLLFSILVIVLMNACSYDDLDKLGRRGDCDTDFVSYSQDVLPIIEANCYNCHGNGATNGGVDLDGHAALASWADDGTLFCTINHDNGCSLMPKNQPQLPECDILKIKNWIDEGAQNN